MVGLSSLDVLEGEVTRISNSGNAMFETPDGEEFNLGPLTEEAVGERVRAVDLSGPWALCVDSRYGTEDYVETMGSRSNLSVDVVYSIVEGKAESDDVGRTVHVGIGSSGPTLYDGDKPINVRREGFLNSTITDARLPVDIVAVRMGVAIGVPALEQISPDEIAPGDLVEMRVEDAADERDATVGSIVDSELPIHATGFAATSGDVATVGVSEVFNTHVNANLAAIPFDRWPDVGETIDVSISLRGGDGDGYGFTDGLPVVVPNALEKHTDLDRFAAAVVTSDGGVVTARVDALDTTDRPALDEVARVEVVNQGEDDTLCRADDTPIRIPGPIPSPIDHFRCRVVDVNDSHLVGSVAEHPEIRSLSEGDEIRIQVDDQDGNDGVGTYRGVPVVVRRGTDVPSEEIRLGVAEITPAKIRANVQSLPDETRPVEGQEIEIPAEAIGPDGRLTLNDGVPVEVPSGLSSLNGTVRLGVVGVGPNSVRCSIHGLPDEVLPEIGEVATMEIDGATVGGSVGRISDVRATLVRTKVSAGSSREVLLVDRTEDALIAVNVDTSYHDLGIKTETVAAYYRAMSGVRNAWQDDDVELAIRRLRSAADVARGDTYAGDIFRLGVQRHEVLLWGEYVRRKRGIQAAQRAVEKTIESQSLPEIPAASWMQEELKGYRHTLRAMSEDSSMRKGYLKALNRTLQEAKEINRSPWRATIPHPLLATLIASVQKPNLPAAEAADKLVTQTPERWPFPTLSEIAAAQQ